QPAADIGFIGSDQCVGHREALRPAGSLASFAGNLYKLPPSNSALPEANGTPFRGSEQPARPGVAPASGAGFAHPVALARCCDAMAWCTVTGSPSVAASSAVATGRGRLRSPFLIASCTQRAVLSHDSRDTVASISPMRSARLAGVSESA